MRFQDFIGLILLLIFIIEIYKYNNQVAVYYEYDSNKNGKII